jgi:hypothetical protein
VEKLNDEAVGRISEKRRKPLVLEVVKKDFVETHVNVCFPTKGLIFADLNRRLYWKSLVDA